MISLLVFTSCQKSDTDTTLHSPKKEEKIQIGFSFDSFVIERWIRDRDVFISTARELGADVITQNANGDVEEQISQIEYLIEKKMDVIVILPGDCDGMKDVVKKARSKGIKVIAYDRQITDTDVDLYITFDGKEVGRLKAQAVLDHIEPGGKVGMILGSQKDYNTILMEEGIEEVFTGEDVEIVFKEYAEGWLEEKGSQYVNTYVQDEDTIDALICGNDNVAGKAIMALAEKRLAGSIYVTGQDANTDACQRIVEGTQHMTVYKSVEKEAKKAAQYAVMLGRGEDLMIEEQYETGSAVVSFVEFNPVAVNKENMDEVITNQFHSDEEVYLNTR